MKKLRTLMTSGAASLGLVAGLAGFAGATSGSINTTGPDSVNRVTHSTRSHVRVHNNNNISASNMNSQRAYSGQAEVEHNTTGGSARSGNAANANALSASVTVDNSKAGAAAAMMPSGGSSSGSITKTGPDSLNVVKSTVRSNVTVNNDNNLSVDNTNCQTATSGDAEVSGNTSGGSATSGNATNTNSTNLTFKVTN